LNFKYCLATNRSRVTFYASEIFIREKDKITDINFSNKFQRTFVYTQVATGRCNVTNVRTMATVKLFKHL